METVNQTLTSPAPPEGESFYFTAVHSYCMFVHTAATNNSVSRLNKQSASSSAKWKLAK